jgi:hypothetical protein
VTALARACRALNIWPWNNVSAEAICGSRPARHFDSSDDAMTPELSATLTLGLFQVCP